MIVDPLADKYPGLSPYVYVANNPVGNYDADGKSINNDYEVKKNKDGSTTTTKTGDTGGDTEDHITYKDENGKVTGKKTVKVQHTTVEGEIFSESRGPGYKIKMIGTKSPAIETTFSPIDAVVFASSKSGMSTLRFIKKIIDNALGTTPKGPGAKGSKRVKKDMMKGGKKAQRDRNFGIKDKKFLKWWEKQKQSMPGKGRHNDLKDSKNAREIYKQWKNGEI